MKRVLLAVVAMLAVTVAGCGGGGEKGKNKDKDVPKSPDAKRTN